MAATLTELLGEELVAHNESKKISTNQLNGKMIALYFSYVAFSTKSDLKVFCLEPIGVPHADHLHQN